MRFINHYIGSWREFQKSLAHPWRRFLKTGWVSILLCAGCISAILILTFFAIPWISGYLGQASHKSYNTPKSPVTHRESLSKSDLSSALKGLLHADPSNLSDHFTLRKDRTPLSVSSSIDPALQSYIIRLLERSRTCKAAVVVLSPTDGRVLAMVTYEKEGQGKNLCLAAEFPAASLFKIVSAAAAIEMAGYDPDRTVYFRGRKHTLYKGQLKEKTRRYASETSFSEAFGSSINPVFGKLGIYDLGQEVLSEYAGRFLFNRPIPFDVPVSVSTVRVPEDDFGLAEIASGFNKETLISPLHAALLSSAVANNGVIMKPWFVDCVLSEKGDVLYKSEPFVLASVINKETAEDLKTMMRSTVLNGTCRKTFRRLRRKKALTDVDFGAKTGNINDPSDQFKYDWLTAYALPQNRNKALSIAVLAVHGKTLGIRANQLGRSIINYYLTL
jgi:peptidoglycan glycosyltransferase